jgi:hypothetical protein
MILIAKRGSRYNVTLMCLIVELTYFFYYSKLYSFGLRQQCLCNHVLICVINIIHQHDRRMFLYLSKKHQGKVAFIRNFP